MADPSAALVLLARYELVARVEDRGLGESWTANDRQHSGRPVAVKFMRSIAPATDLPGELSSALKGLRVFRHPMCPAIVNQGVWESRPFIVHDLVVGESLGTRLDRARSDRRPEDLSLVRSVFESVCALLDAAHRAPLRVLHGALTPGSVIVHTRPEGALDVKVLDLALAPWTGPPTDGPARSARLLVNHAPEQFQGGATTERTDVYSLGALLREVLALPAPEGQTMMPALAERQRSDVPEAVWAEVARATAIDPAGRHPTVAAFQKVLAGAWARGPAAPREAAEAKAAASGSLFETIGPVAATPAPPSLRDAPLSRPVEVATQEPVYKLPELPLVARESAPVAQSPVDPRSWNDSVIGSAAQMGADDGATVVNAPASEERIDAGQMLAKLRVRSAASATGDGSAAPSAKSSQGESLASMPPAQPMPAGPEKPAHEPTMASQPPMAMVQPQAPPPKARSVMTIAVVAVIALFFGALGLYVFYLRG